MASDEKPQPQSPPDAREQAVMANLLRRLATQGGSAVGVAVLVGAPLTSVLFVRKERDTKYGVIVVPSWDTTVAIAAADKTMDGFTVHFGTVAPMDATIDFLTFRAG